MIFFNLTSKEINVIDKDYNVINYQSNEFAKIMQELIKKQTEEVKAVNPEAGVINAVIMPTETGSQLFVSILANASDVAEIINSIFEQHPQVREALGGIIMAKSMAVMMQHHDKYLENESEGFIEVN